MRPQDAFEICLEVYKAARELVDSRQPTTQLETSSKFIWRPDLRPRMVEYVADFALAGSRALGDASGQTSFRRSSAAVHGATLSRGQTRERKARSRIRASRLILFRVYYLGGAEYQAARRLLGISELTWADWVDEIKHHVGRELLRGGLFPPGRYFRVVTCQKHDGGRRRTP